MFGRTLAMLLLPLATTADVSATHRFNNYCTTGDVITCASVSVSLVRLPNGQTAVVIEAQNLSGSNQSVNVSHSLLSDLFLTFPFELDPGFSPNGQLLIAPGNGGRIEQPGKGYALSLRSNSLTISGTAGNGVGVFGCDPAPGGTEYPNFGGPFTGAFITCPRSGTAGPIIFTFTPDDPVDFWTLENMTVRWQMNTPNGAVVCQPGVNCFQSPATVAPEPQ